MAPNQGEGPTTPAYEANKDKLVQLQIRTERLEHASRRIGLLPKLVLGIIGIAAAAGLASLALDAVGSRGVVVDAFHVAPAVSATGVTGDVVAARIRNRLTEMRATTSSSRAGDVLESGWIEDYRIEIPRTGLTLTEINSAFRSRLGNETHVRGDLFPAGEGLQMTFTISGRRTRLAANDLDGLIIATAEAVYKEVDPYLFATYLSGQQGRRDESNAVLAEIAAGAVGPTERAWALNGLAANIIEFEGRCRDGLVLLAEAQRLGPRIPNIYGNFSNAYYCLGHDQAAADATLIELGLLGLDEGHVDPERIRELRLQDQSSLAGAYDDHRRRLAILDRMERAGLGDQNVERARLLAEIGDLRGSNAALRRHRAMVRRGAGERPTTIWGVRFAQAWAMEDWPRAALFRRGMNAVHKAEGANSAAQVVTQSRPLEAIALARSGELRRAAALTRALPDDCFACARSRAIVADLQGRHALADRLFRHAVSLAPRLPAAYVDWGAALMRRDDPAAALVRFDMARRHAPQSAGAHKGRGDALAALRRDREADRAYHDAFRRAPRWGALHLEWARVLWRLGRRNEARERLRAARAMDLGAADQRRLHTMMDQAGL